MVKKVGLVLVVAVVFGLGVGAQVQADVVSLGQTYCEAVLGGSWSVDGSTCTIPNGHSGGIPVGDELDIRVGESLVVHGILEVEGRVTLDGGQLRIEPDGRLQAGPSGQFAVHARRDPASGRIIAGQLRGYDQQERAEETLGDSGAVNGDSGTITIGKYTTPKHERDFTFSGDLGTFSLDDDSDPTLPNSRIFAGLSAGTYAITEGEDPYFELNSMSCSWSGESDTDLDLDSRTITVTLEAGGTVDCAFGNKCIDSDGDGVCDVDDICPGYDDGQDADGDGKPDGCDGSIVIRKYTTPDHPQDFTFSGDLGPFSLDDDGDPTLPNSRTFDGLVAGTYAITEGVDPYFELNSMSCSWSGESDVDLDLDTRTIIVTLEVGGPVDCGFGNKCIDSDGDGVCDVDDICLGHDDGQDADGDDVPDGCDLCPGHDDGVDADGDGVPDDCDVCPGFDDSADGDADNVPDDCDNCPATHNAGQQDGDGDDLGDACDCTIVVEKQTMPGSAPGVFTFSGDVLGAIGDGGQLTVTDLMPGTYSSTEADPEPEYGLLSITCSDDNSSGNIGTRTATFQIEPAEEVTCTFTNGERDLAVTKDLLLPTGGLAAVGQRMRFEIEVENVGDAPVGPISLRDEYQPWCMFPVRAEVPPDAQDNSAGWLEWSNIGTLNPGMTTTMWVEFDATHGCDPATNSAIASVGSSAFQGDETVRLLNSVARLGGLLFHDEMGTGSLSQDGGVAYVSAAPSGREGIEGGVVTIGDQAYTTNTSGWYSFNLMEPGTYTVSPTMIGEWWRPTGAESCQATVATTWDMQYCDFGYWWGLRAPGTTKVAAGQQMTFYPIQDTTVSAWDAGPFGADRNLWVRQRGDASSLLQFDLTRLPKSAQIVSAELRMYSTGGSNENRLYMTAYEMAEPWDEATATWPEPAYGDAVGWAWLNAPGWAVFDLDPARVAGKEHGFIVRGEGSENRKVGYSFLSSDFPSIAQQPQLVISYDMP